MKKPRLIGFECVANCFDEKSLCQHIAQEDFRKISKYFSLSPHWLCFRGQYVPKNFIIGAYATPSMDSADTLHLALITGSTCHDFVHEKDTLEQLEILDPFLPHADILNSGHFSKWWGVHREELADHFQTLLQEGADFWPLVHQSLNIKPVIPSPGSD